MKLKIRRSQKSSMMGNAVFSLNFVVDLSEEELKLIDKYKLSKMQVYSSEAFQKNISTAAGMATGQVNVLTGVKSLATAVLFNLKITVNDLANGKGVEMKDLEELLSAENQVVQACQNLKGYLEVAKSFDGREEIIEI